MKDSPRSAIALAGWAELLFDSSRTSEGAAAYRQAIAVSPHAWSLRLGFAQRLRSAGNLPAATEELYASLAEHPTPTGLLQLTTVLIAAGRYEQAIDFADRVIVANNAPAMMVRLRDIADSAWKVSAPPGSVDIVIRATTGAR